MTSHSDTPITDAWQDADWNECSNYDDYKRMLLAYDHARTLERELSALTAQLAECRRDAERYRARRNYEWCEYDEYCDSVMPRDGSATRQYFDAWRKQYDENSDSIVEDYSETPSDQAIQESKK